MKHHEEKIKLSRAKCKKCRPKKRRRESKSAQGPRRFAPQDPLGQFTSIKRIRTPAHSNLGSMGCVASRNTKTAKDDVIITEPTASKDSISSLEEKLGMTLAELQESFFLDLTHRELTASDCKSLASLAFPNLMETVLTLNQVDERAIGAEGRMALSEAKGKLKLMHGYGLP